MNSRIVWLILFPLAIELYINFHSVNLPFCTYSNSKISVGNNGSGFSIKKFKDSSAIAFPGAEGFGKFAVGGRGGKIIEVTSLNDSGPGSLRNAIDAKGPRIVIFKVAGYITLKSPLIISNDSLSIMGQTAPGLGITLRIDGKSDIHALRIQANNIIIRGLNIRPGTGVPKSVNGDAITLIKGENIIIDHCSFSWSTDEIINPYGASKITFQSCIFSEALLFANHKYSSDPENSNYRKPHSMGMLIGNGSNEISIYQCIFAHNNQRNPLIKDAGSEVNKIEIVNNVIYNWGYFATVLTPETSLKINLINNLYIPGVNTKTNRYAILINDSVRAFSIGNYTPQRKFVEQTNWEAVGWSKAPFDNIAPNQNQKFSPFNFPLGFIREASPEQILKTVLDNAGGIKPCPVDTRIIQDIRAKTGSFINSPEDVGGYHNIPNAPGYLDFDKDGIDDYWEMRMGLNPQDPEDGKKKFNEDGYSNLDDFLNYLAQKKF